MTKQYRQRGLSLIGMLVVGGLIAFAAVIAMKVTPAIIEYYTIVRNINAIVQSGETKGATVSDIRKLYEKRAAIDNTPSVAPEDLDISKEQGVVVIAFSYSRKIPLFANVSLCLDFEGSTKPTTERDI
jgi:hypothetical protein